MAIALDPKQVVSFEELLMSQVVQITLSHGWYTVLHWLIY